MSTVADVIEDIRLELHDNESTRWTDAQIIRFVRRAVERMNHILIKNGVQFAKSFYSFDTVASTSTYALPSDFLIQQGLYRDDWDIQLTFRSDDSWERIISAADTTNWRINGSNIEITGTPSKAITLHFYYWPNIDTSAYATTTTMPWGGKMDNPIVEYVAAKLMNVDELDITADSQMLTDITNSYIANYSANEPSASEVNGFYYASGWDNGAAE